MTIRVGTLVTRYWAPTKSNPCEEHIDWEMHSEAGTDGILDVCLGVVIECNSDNPEIVVNWVQQCPYAKQRREPAQDTAYVDDVYEVGQLR